MKKLWDEEAWNMYVSYQTEDKKTLKKINELIKNIERNGEKEGIGKPERLKGNLSDYYSRKIDEKNRLVYKIENNEIKIIQCGTHYKDK